MEGRSDGGKAWEQCYLVTAEAHDHRSRWCFSLLASQPSTQQVINAVFPYHATYKSCSGLDKPVKPELWSIANGRPDLVIDIFLVET